MKKLVFVTGAGRGIGQFIAVKLAEEGYVVAGCSRTADQLEETKKLSKGKIRTTALDVTNARELDAWFDREERETGATPWGLVTAAGIYGPIGPFLENSWEDWRQGIEINLYGTALALKFFSQRLISKKLPGRIVLFSGGGATQPLPNFSNYCATKAAVVRFGETVAQELTPHGITVNSVAPGAVNTKLTEDVLKAGPEKVGREAYEKALKQKESGGTNPDKAAQLISFLMSERSSKVTAKLISAVWDPWSQFQDQGDKLGRSDVYTLRRIVPEDRPKDWPEAEKAAKK